MLRFISVPGYYGRESKARGIRVGIYLRAGNDIKVAFQTSESWSINLGSI